MRISWIVGLGFAGMIALPSAQAHDRPALPAATRDVTICIYKALKAAPALYDISVYANPPDGALIVYDWRIPAPLFDRHAKTTIAIGGPDDQGRFHYSGAIGAGNNLIDGMKDQLANVCHADGGFIDQDFLDDGQSSIDMSQYVN